MRNSLCLELLVSAAVLLLSGCEVGPRSRRTYFFEKEKKSNHHSRCVQRHDYGTFLVRYRRYQRLSDPGFLILRDSSFAGMERQTRSRVFFTSYGMGNFGKPSFRQAIHKKPTRAAISNVDLVYNYLHIRNQKYGSAEDLQGTVGFPDNDSTHVWEA